MMFNIPRYQLVTIVFLAILLFIYLLFHIYSVSVMNPLFIVVMKNQSNVYTKPRILSPFSNKQVPNDFCVLSLMESDGWICESNDDWNLRKQLHRVQDRRNRKTNTVSAFFEKNWEPTIHCSFDQRIGNIGDGGKWVCDIHKLKINNTKPLIYSFGSKGDFSFEKAAKEVLPNAEIHTFDSRVYTCPPGVCTFHQATIGDGKKAETKSLTMIIDELGHQQRTIDIFKVDIEGSEYAMFTEFFKHPLNTNSDNDAQENNRKLPYIRQIQMEIHLSKNNGDQSSLAAHELFELFRFNNYAIFHKEANLYCPRSCFEYAFLRLNRKFFIASQ